MLPHTKTTYTNVCFQQFGKEPLLGVVVRFTQTFGLIVYLRHNVRQWIGTHGKFKSNPIPMPVAALIMLLGNRARFPKTLFRSP